MPQKINILYPTECNKQWWLQIIIARDTRVSSKINLRCDKKLSQYLQHSYFFNIIDVVRLHMKSECLNSKHQIQLTAVKAARINKSTIGSFSQSTLLVVANSSFHPFFVKFHLFFSWFFYCLSKSSFRYSPCFSNNMLTVYFLSNVSVYTVFLQTVNDLDKRLHNPIKFFVV